MASLRKPLHVANGYALRTLDSVTEEAFAEIFQEICQRGNPLLQGRPRSALLHLGSLLYQSGIEDPVSTVMTTQSGEIAAVCVSWDLRGGGLWSGLEVPESLRCHAAVAAACIGSLASTENVHFGAFCGVKRGHNRQILMPGLVFSVLGSACMGYDHRFGYTVHPSMLAFMNEEGEKYGTRREGAGISTLERKWELPYFAMDAPSNVKAELMEMKLDYATCALTHLRVFREHLLTSTVDTETRHLIQDIDAAAQAHLWSKNIPVEPATASRPLQIIAAPVASKL